MCYFEQIFWPQLQESSFTHLCSPRWNLDVSLSSHFCCIIVCYCPRAYHNGSLNNSPQVAMDGILTRFKDVLMPRLFLLAQKWWPFSEEPKEEAVRIASLFCQWQSRICMQFFPLHCCDSHSFCSAVFFSILRTLHTEQIFFLTQRNGLWFFSPSIFDLSLPFNGAACEGVRKVIIMSNIEEIAPILWKCSPIQWFSQFEAPFSEFQPKITERGCQMGARA